MQHDSYSAVGHGLSYFGETPKLHQIEDLYGFKLQTLTLEQKIAAMHCASFIWIAYTNDDVQDLDAEIMGMVPAELDDIMDGLNPYECHALIQCLAENIVF